MINTGREKTPFYLQHPLQLRSYQVSDLPYSGELFYQTIHIVNQKGLYTGAVTSVGTHKSSPCGMA